jgi:hypothetical protein
LIILRGLILRGLILRVLILRVSGGTCVHVAATPVLSASLS